ncbi:MAG: agmatine deiminase family protein [Bacteroidota bacterium]
MKLLSLCLSLILFVSSCGDRIPKDDKKEEKPFSFPPEWEPQQAMWITIHDQWGDPEFVEMSVAPRLEVVKALHNHVPVKLLTTSDSLAQVFTERLAGMDVDTSKVTTIINPQTTFYLRDPGPIFLTNGEELKMANWQGIDSTTLQRRPDMALRKAVDDTLAVQYGYDIKNSPLSFDGGAVDVSSNSAISIKDYAVLHNPHMSLEEIEKEILDTYGKEQMIWLEGVAMIDENGLKVDNYWGQAPGGHVDAVVRFVNDSTILATTISEEDKDKNPIAAHDYRIFKGYLEQLKAARRPNGEPYNIVEIPSPVLNTHLIPVPKEYWPTEELDLLYEDGLPSETDTILVVPALGYANFLITNAAVLVAQYWQEGMPESEKAKDEEVVSILQNYFPDREIIGLNPVGINLSGGGIHCTTQQEPRTD